MHVLIAANRMIPILTIILQSTGYSAHARATFTFVVGIGYRCPRCDYTNSIHKAESSDEANVTPQKISNPIIISDSRETSIYTLPTIAVNCPNCSHSSATFRTQAVGTDDDVLIIHLFRCTQCGYRWRQEEN